MLFETIRIENGKVHNIDYHNARLNLTRKKLFDTHDNLEISDYLKNIPTSGVYRAKIIYDKNIINTTYYIYKAKTIQKLLIVEANIDYDYKYLNRDQFDKLSSSNQNFDELIISKDGLITDTTIANIALKKNGTWYTPTKPLLLGTTRARLLDEGRLVLRDIQVSDIDSYDSLALMNAMIGFAIISTPTITK